MTILVIVANSSHARFLTADAQAAPLREWYTLEHPASRLREQDLVTEGPGTGRDSGGFGRHSMGHEGEARRQEFRHFAEQLCDAIDDALPKDIHKLYLVAAPHFLGLLRDALSPAAKGILQATIDKDLVEQDLLSIREHLPDYL